MYKELVQALREHADKMCVTFKGAHACGSNLALKAAGAIEKLNKRIDFLMNCIYEAEDALDRGADNEWARASLEKTERGKEDV